MNSNNFDNSVFIVVSLFLLTIISIMLSIQLIAWLIIHLKTNKMNFPTKSYQTLLEQEQYDGTIKKVKFITKFNNYNKKTNCLKLKVNDFEEKTLWNFYQNLINVLLVKWKKNNKKTHITLITSTLIFYLSIIMTITCTLIYYINLGQGTINNLNVTLLSIFSFVILMILIFSWLIWTMSYEKVRKEIIELANTFEEPKLSKAVKIISAYKTLVPGSELLF